MVFVVGLRGCRIPPSAHFCAVLPLVFVMLLQKKNLRLTAGGKPRRLLTDFWVAVVSRAAVSVRGVNQALSGVCLVIWAACQIDPLWVNMGTETPTFFRRGGGGFREL